MRFGMHDPKIWLLDKRTQESRSLFSWTFSGDRPVKSESVTDLIAGQEKNWEGIKTKQDERQEVLQEE